MPQRLTKAARVHAPRASRELLFLLLAALLAVAPACRSSYGIRHEVTDASYFPPPPNPARIQFVRALHSSLDLDSGGTVYDYVLGAKKTPDYALKKPFSVATSEGKIYVTDSFGLRGLAVFDLEHHGSYMLGRKPGAGELLKPIHVSVDEDGYKYVSDRGLRAIVVYGPDDNYARTYGDGESFIPGACVVRGDEVFVLDIKADPVEVERAGETVERNLRRDQILVLDKKTGAALRRIGMHGPAEEGFSFAGQLTLDTLGNLYVTDLLHHRVVRFDREGNVTREFGEAGRLWNQFGKIKGVAVDRDGLVYVADAEFHMVKVFDNAGHSLFFFGEPWAQQGGMALPGGVCIDYDNVDYFRSYYGPDFEPEYLVLVANQMGDVPNVSVYAYGKRVSQSYPDGGALTGLEDDVRTLWRLPVFSPDVYRPPQPGELAAEPDARQ